MKCSEYEPMIYLWKELTPDEQLQLEEHLHICPCCTTLFAGVQKMHERVELLSQDKASVPNVAHFISSIMSAVNAQPGRNESILLRWLNFDTILRYSLASGSLILIIAFGMEYMKINPSAKIHFNENLKNTVVLNSDMIHSREHLERPKSILAACKSPFTDRIAYIECIKSQIH